MAFPAVPLLSMLFATLCVLHARAADARRRNAPAAIPPDAMQHLQALQLVTFLLSACHIVSVQ